MSIHVCVSCGKMGSFFLVIDLGLEWWDHVIDLLYFISRSFFFVVVKSLLLSNPLCFKHLIEMKTI